MSQDALFGDPSPPAPADVDLRCCDVAELLSDPAIVGAARLVVADGPWDEYRQRPGVAAPDLTYPTLSMDDILKHIDRSFDCASPGARLLSWCCWPILRDWYRADHVLRWESVTGGSWQKDVEQPGVGYHWLGHDEPALVYARRGGTPYTDRSVQLRNAWRTTVRMDHSEKPVDWHRLMLRRWTEPGDLVLDLYAGRAPVARACLAEGRRYVGAEIHEGRHRKALGLLAQYRPEPLG